jgi:hypothetical protein
MPATASKLSWQVFQLIIRTTTFGKQKLSDSRVKPATPANRSTLSPTKKLKTK